MPGTSQATTNASTITIVPMVATVNGAPMKWAVTPAKSAPTGMKPRSSMYRLITLPRNSSGTISCRIVEVLARKNI